ncbi:MAG: PadR family transcriptional regulator [Acidimicrobiales bacterium]
MSTSSDDRRGNLPRAYQRACLLILLAEGSAHGYDLLEQVRGAGLAGAEAGGLYRCLRSMEEDGLVTSWWEPSQAGPPRRTYLLSVEGEQAAEEWAAGLEEVGDQIAALLARYAARTGRALR